LQRARNIVAPLARERVEQSRLIAIAVTLNAKVISRQLGRGFKALLHALSTFAVEKAGLQLLASQLKYIVSGLA
jgi:hypothetical protein